MKWNLFLTALISALFSIFPQNLIGCGPTEDPYDYYTSFFSQNNIENKNLRPFYYSGLLNFYDDFDADEDQDKESKRITTEWRQYCKNQPSLENVSNFVYSKNMGQVSDLIIEIETKGQTKAPSNAKQNSMASYLVSNKNKTALSYLLLAKQTEKYCVSEDWSVSRKSDSIDINNHISKAQVLLKETNDPFLNNKLASLCCKLAFYNTDYKNCIKWYNEYFTDGYGSFAEEAAGSYKAGSLFRLGKNKEAAYVFSRLFSSSSLLYQKKYFQGFNWATDQCNPELEEVYTSQCKNNREKSVMYAMFGMHGASYRLANIRKVFQLDPSSPLLPLLITREISKLEEKYLTPSLRKEKGGKQYYYSWIENEDLSDDRKQLDLTLKFLETAALQTDGTNKGLYYTAASYLSLIKKDFSGARKFIESARSLELNEKLRNQIEICNLLIQANEPLKIDAAAESKILPSLQWLRKKALKSDEYKIFLRNFQSEILAQRYEQQNEDFRAVLAYGTAGLNGNYPEEAKEFLQNEMSTSQLVKLYSLFINKNPTAFEKFLLQYSSLKKDDVVNMLGTSYLRDFNFEKAVEWLKKSKEQDQLINDEWDYIARKDLKIYVDPFFDYINDWERYNRRSATAYTKLLLAQKLLELKNKIAGTKDKEAKARLCYKMATALYNMSYYGNSWKAVDYFRRSSAWNTGKYKAPWEKEYYGVHQSKAFYQKAYELTANKELKPACYFMVAKCAQRQVIMPVYDDYEYQDYDKRIAEFQKKFHNNPLFPNFKKQFGDTKFYGQVFNSCSYLRDFVNKNR